MLCPSQLPSRGDVVDAARRASASAPSTSSDLGQRSRRRTCPPRPPNRHRGWRRRRPPASTSRARARRRCPRRRSGKRRSRLGCAERIELEELRVVVEHLLEMRRRASARRLNSGRSRRRGGRGCRRRAIRSRREQDAAPRASASPLRLAWRQRNSRIGGFGNFGAPLQAAVLRVEERRRGARRSGRDRPGRGRGPRRRLAPPRRGLLDQAATVVRDPRPAPPWKTRATSLQDVRRSRAGRSAAPSGNRCRPRTARRPGVRNMVSGQPPCSPRGCSALM